MEKPPPIPDAWHITVSNEPLPLWNQNRLPEWHEWKTKRDTIVEEMHAQERANTAKKAWIESLT